MYLLQVRLRLINIIQMGLIFKIVLILLQVFLLVIQVNPLLDLKVHPKYVTCLINLRGSPVSFRTTNVFITVYIKCQACHKWGCKSCNHRPPGQVDFTKSKAKPQGQAHVASTIAASSGQSAFCENGPGFPQSDQASPSPACTILCSHCLFAWKSWKGLQFPPLRLPPVPTPWVASSCPKPRVRP